MTLRQCVVTVAITAALVASAVPLIAQGAEKFTARLGWVPTAGPNDRANVTGKGTATGTLSGRKLTINGTFEGLAAPATIARLHQGITKGARGAAITDLTVSKGRERHAHRIGRSDRAASRGAAARQAVYSTPQREGLRSRWQQSLGLVSQIDRSESGR